MPDSFSTPYAVALAGEESLLALYGATSTTLFLNTHTRQCFTKAVATCPIQLAALPPTSAAAREHYCHVYHRGQQWLGNDLLSSDWRWDLVNGHLRPVLNRLPPAMNVRGDVDAEGLASRVLWYADSVVV